MSSGDRKVDASTVAMFQETWAVYRKVVDNNYLFHREAYGSLRRVLTEDVAGPFRFLDIACGDASASAGALRGTQVAKYHGIDFSAHALALAEDALADLGCEVVLEQRDFLDAVAERTDLADVIWIGLSLHHLETAGKLDFMRQLRAGLADGGRLLIFENTSPDGEDRDTWLGRWDLQRPNWPAYTESDWEGLRNHVRAADYPETDASWHRLGRDAGFAETQEIYRTPTDLFRVYSFTT
jgi:cyclopropane fatty-acyl-phospholipid synthase-like methyltransferase